MRNRWRQQTIPWSEVTSVQTSASIGYTVVLSVRTLSWMFGHGDRNYVEFASSLLAVHREGHRFGIPLYATIGNPMGPHHEAFRAALASAGHPVQDPDEVGPTEPPESWAAPQQQ